MSEVAQPLETTQEVRFKCWEKLNVEGDVPTVRQGHAIAVAGDTAYLFGGSGVSDDGSGLFYNDLYSLQLNNPQECKWVKINQAGDIPTGREGHSMNVVGTELYLLGGVDSDSATKCIEGLHVLNTESYSWSVREVSGQLPQAQSSSSYVVTNDKRIVTFGGVLNGKAINDTFILNTVTLEWICAETTGTKPQPRCDHGTAIVDNKLYVFGGSGGESLWLNDLSCLNLETLQWVLLSPIAQTPCPRDYPTLLAINTKIIKILLVFGGFTGVDGEEKCLNDCHYLPLRYATTLSWYPALTEDSPLPEGRYGHTAFCYQNKIYIQGGQDATQMFNDLWMIEAILPEVHFSPTVPPRRKYTTPTPIPTPRKNLSPPTLKEINERSFEHLRIEYRKQIEDIFDTLTQKYQELDKMTATLAAEREQFESEKKELYENYDRQQQELQELIHNYEQENEGWVELMRRENDKERKAIAEEKAKLAKDMEDLEKEKAIFTEKSTKLDAIMKQVKGL